MFNSLMLPCPLPGAGEYLNGGVGGWIRWEEILHQSGARCGPDPCPLARTKAPTPPSCPGGGLRSPQKEGWRVVKSPGMKPVPHSASRGVSLQGWTDGSQETQREPWGREAREAMQETEVWRRQKLQRAERRERVAIERSFERTLRIARTNGGKGRSSEEGTRRWGSWGEMTQQLAWPAGRTDHDTGPASPSPSPAPSQAPGARGAPSAACWEAALAFLSVCKLESSLRVEK